LFQAIEIQRYKRVGIGAGCRNPIAAVCSELVPGTQGDIGSDPQDLASKRIKPLRDGMCGTVYLAGLAIAYRNIEVPIVVTSREGGRIEQQIADEMNLNSEPNPKDLASCALER